MNDCLFIREIEEFKLDHYWAYMGWIGNKQHKIYTLEDSLSFFVYDEYTNRLFEFELAGHKTLKTSTIYKLLISAYLTYQSATIL